MIKLTLMRPFILNLIKRGLGFPVALFDPYRYINNLYIQKNYGYQCSRARFQKYYHIYFPIEC